MHPKNKPQQGTTNTEGQPLLSPKRKAPSFQFYANDWLADTQLGRVSLAAHGLWINMLCRMWVSDKQGYLIGDSEGTAPSVSQIARDCRCTVEEAEKGLKELERNNIFSRTADGVIYSRRMLRSIEERNAAAESGRSGGNPWLKRLKASKEGVNPTLNPPLNQPLNGGGKQETKKDPHHRPKAPETAPRKKGRMPKVSLTSEQHRKGFFS